MPRFLLSPRWIAFHLLVASAVVVMISLGFWQLRRLDERQQFNDRVIERTERAPIALDDVLASLAGGDLAPDDAEWLPVRATGTFLDDQIVEFNQSQAGRAGENVLSGLVLDDGTTVVVNRGFVVLGTEMPPAPDGDVEILGLVRTSEVRERGGLTDSTDGELTEVRRIDLDLIGSTVDGGVAPVYVQLVSSDPEVGSDGPEPVARPVLDDGPHLSYAVQWFIFSACVAVGWVLAVRRSVRRRRANGVAPSTDETSTTPERTSTPSPR